MTNKKRQHKPRFSAVVIEARAGLIPESDDTEDERRARMDRTIRVLRILKAHARLPTCGSEGQAITDLIADFRHYCHWSSLPFHNFYRAANALYLEEKDELWQKP